MRGWRYLLVLVSAPLAVLCSGTAGSAPLPAESLSPLQEPVRLGIVLTDGAGAPIFTLDPAADDPAIGGGDFFVTFRTNEADDLATYAQRITFDSTIVRYIGQASNGLPSGAGLSPGDLNVNAADAAAGPAASLTVSAIGIAGYTGPRVLVRLAFEVVTPGASGVVAVADAPTSSAPYANRSIQDIPHPATGIPASYTTRTLETPTPIFTPTFTPTLAPTETPFTPTPPPTFTPLFTPTATVTPTPTETSFIPEFGDLDEDGTAAAVNDSLLWSLTWQSRLEGPGDYNPQADYEKDGDVDRHDLDRYLELTRREGRPPLPQIVVTEFMAQSVLEFETRGEFVELYNNDIVPVDLFGWTLRDRDGDYALINKHLVVSPGQAVVLANTMDPCRNGGIEPDFVYPSQGAVQFRFDNTGDEIILTNDRGQIVDEVIYRHKWLPVIAGVSFRAFFPGRNNLRVYDPGLVPEFPCEEANWGYSSPFVDGSYGTISFPWCDTRVRQIGSPGRFTPFPDPDPYGCQFAED